MSRFSKALLSGRMVENHLETERRLAMGKLQERMKRDMELRNFSLRTIKSYLWWMRDFVMHYGRSPEELGDEEIRSYLHFLLKEKDASQASLSQAYSALKFFYERTLGREWNETRIPRSLREKKLPVVLSLEEVQEAFNAIKNLKHRTILTTIYSGGLRLGEALRLKVRDIDSRRMMIRVRQGKGHKDRYTLLGEKALKMLRIYWDVYRPREWLFPSTNLDQPLHPSSVQRVFRKALREAGIEKEASVHTLRHSFATHLLEEGIDLFYIQRLLGHTTPNTTAIYLHVARKDIKNIRSPIDQMPEMQDPDK
jgi:integrase/recombinase XerD